MKVKNKVVLCMVFIYIVCEVVVCVIAKCKARGNDTCGGSGICGAWLTRSN